MAEELQLSPELAPESQFDNSGDLATGPDGDAKIKRTVTPTELQEVT